MYAFSVCRSSRHIEKDQGTDEGSADNAVEESSAPQVCCVQILWLCTGLKR